MMKTMSWVDMAARGPGQLLQETMMMTILTTILKWPVLLTVFHAHVLLDRRRRECGRDSENFIKLIFYFLFLYNRFLGSNYLCFA